ncbi:uncharacterized protein Dana_GF23296 [Drosophila ananassae]|uniref:MD-2-related lipid-recognition domain-containing protein n=1 Tax=Drosophila ananassae TaxID=7217 RepID=A0A0P8ZE15_DROAN|nr:uncharacterized protein LOC6505938 [Drosophila ananassae]KPU72867.1 uncharacterized protein Dana_GF23296 [Drosophila ananassae]
MVLLWLLFAVSKVSCKFEFTNIKCTSLDEKFAGVEYCYLKSVNRSYKYLSLKVNLFKTPITKIKINAALYKRFNGYRPFMYNITVDFLKNPSSNAAMNYLFGFFRNFSNINHTCPYDHDIIVDKLDINAANLQVTKVLPVPEGDYLVETHWIAYDIDRAIVKVYCSVS